MPTQPLRYEPSESDVAALIRAAGNHPLGVGFLMNGHLGSVAITFGHHAFTVIAARDQLTRSEDKKAS